MMPAAVLSEQKRNYGTKDLFDWVQYWNTVNTEERTMEKPIDFHYPTIFPIRSPALLRCAIVDPSCIPALCMPFLTALLLSIYQNELT
jgi:hypothetical protein